jgi:F-type H+-transporting ATPase subunit delta
MNISLVSVRYAKALFKTGIDKGIMEKLYKDVNLILSQCNEQPGFCDIMNSPVIKPSKKKAFLKDIFGKAVNKYTLRFLDIIIDNSRADILVPVFMSFIDLYKKDKKIKTVTLYSAFEMDKAYSEKVKKLLIKELGKPLELKIIVKEDLLGGFILKVDDKMVDASITGKLQQIRNHLING